MNPVLPILYPKLPGHATSGNEPEASEGIVTVVGVEQVRDECASSLS